MFQTVRDSQASSLPALTPQTIHEGSTLTLWDFPILTPPEKAAARLLSENWVTNVLQHKQLSFGAAFYIKWTVCLESHFLYFVQSQLVLWVNLFSVFRWHTICRRSHIVFSLWLSDFLVRVYSVCTFRNGIKWLGRHSSFPVKKTTTRHAQGPI